MSLAKAGRKLKRAGKSAVQFRFTSTFEYIDLECIGPWRPENLKVVWQRAHRRVESNNIQWVAVADRGPDGATGRALFEPAISVALIVTLYRDPKTTSFEEKVYKYYIEHEGALGKKVLASFNCDVAEYAGIPSTKSALELDCKPVSKKVRKAHIGVTLESEYIKEGVANDEDMQSTYSHMTTVGVVMDDQDSDEETFPLPSNGVKPAEHKDRKLNAEKTMPTLVECSGTFEREPKPEKLRESEPREDKDSKLEREAVLPEKVVESCGLGVDTVASQPVTQRDSLLENEGLSQPTPEERDSQMEKKKLLSVGKGEAARDGQQSGLIVNGGSDVVAEQETQRGSVVSKEDEKASVQEATVGGDNVVEQTEDDAPSHREDNGAEAKVRNPVLAQSETGKDDKQEVSSAQEIKPQEDLKLQEVGWVEAPPETNRKEDSLPPASWVMVAGGERQGSPLSPNEGMPKGEGVVPSGTSEAVQVTNRTVEGMDEGKSQTVKEMEGNSGTVVIDVAKADTDPEAVKSQIQQQPSAELEGKGTGTVATAVNDTSLPSPKPEEERTLKGTQPEAGADVAVPQKMSTARSDKVESPALQPWLPPTVQLVNQNGTPVPVSELDNKQIIGLYFTAQWCPPCRKFMPKLIKFYKVLKENNCRFHLIYVSSDHTEEDMFEYMQMQKVPFPAISFTSSVGDELRQKYGVHQVPHLVIINRDCQLVDEQARKSVEYAVSNTSAMQCYQDWLEGLAPKNGRKTVSDGVHKAESPKKEQPTTGPSPAAAASEREESESAKSQDTRRTVQSQSRGKTASSQELEEKLEYIRELEADKEALQLRVTEVAVENERLKSRVEDLEERLREVNSVQSDLLREKKDLADQMNLRGWLMKRGVHGPTGRKWRRRFFRTDQGNQLCYYKGTTGEPQGWIDLSKVKDVRKSSSETQDKNNLTFEVETEGRVYELLAENGPDMEKWMTAIKNLAEFCQSNVDGSQATRHS